MKTDNYGLHRTPKGFIRDKHIIINAGRSDSEKAITLLGANRYIREFLFVLSKIDKFNKYIIARNERMDCFKKRANFLTVPEEFLIKKRDELNAFNADIFQSFWPIPPLARYRAFILFITDTIYEIFPEIIPETVPKFSSTYRQKILREGFKQCAQIANIIITPSVSTKNDVIKYYKINPERIRVIPCGVSSNFRKIHNLKLLKQFKIKHNLKEPFILFVSHRQTYHKNFLGLLKAFSILKQTTNTKIKLVAVGPPARPHKIELDLIKKLRLDKEIKFVGYIVDEDLVLFYNTARAFVCSSLYEGFGLPPLEAMACGLPVAASNVSSIPEVVGDAALFFDPHNGEEMADALLKVIYDETKRKELIKKGLKRAKLFSWEKMVKQTLKVYKEVV